MYCILKTPQYVRLRAKSIDPLDEVGLLGCLSGYCGELTVTDEMAA